LIIDINGTSFVIGLEWESAGVTEVINPKFQYYAINQKENGIQIAETNSKSVGTYSLAMWVANNISTGTVIVHVDDDKLWVGSTVDGLILSETDKVIDKKDIEDVLDVVMAASGFDVYHVGAPIEGIESEEIEIFGVEDDIKIAGGNFIKIWKNVIMLAIFAFATSGGVMWHWKIGPFEPEAVKISLPTGPSRASILKDHLLHEKARLLKEAKNTNVTDAYAKLNYIISNLESHITDWENSAVEIDFQKQTARALYKKGKIATEYDLRHKMPSARPSEGKLVVKVDFPKGSFDNSKILYYPDKKNTKMILNSIGEIAKERGIRFELDDVVKKKPKSVAERRRANKASHKGNGLPPIYQETKWTTSGDIGSIDTLFKFIKDIPGTYIRKITIDNKKITIHGVVYDYNEIH